MEHLEALPKSINVPYGDGIAYLTVATYAKGWQCAYIDYGGYAVKGYHTYGRSAYEAILNMKEKLDTEREVLRLLKAPAVSAEEDKHLKN